MLADERLVDPTDAMRYDLGEVVRHGITQKGKFLQGSNAKATILRFLILR